MRMCQSHWDMLREEVKAQGLYDLVSANGDIVAMKLVAELKGSPDSRDNFDPLMRCNFMIMNRVMDGLGLMVMAEDFGCPICFLNSQRAEDGSCKCGHPQCPNKQPGSLPDFETWIVGPESCVASVREMAEARGWLKNGN